MKDKLYTIFFTILLSCISAGILTFADTRWQDLIKANESFGRVCAILKTLGLFEEGANRKDILEGYTKSVVATTKGAMEVFEGRKDGKLVGYTMEIIGRGKYGPIKGFLAVEPTSTRILNFNIYDQNETPGLGGRIADKEWLCQFRGIPLMNDGVPGVVISSSAKGPNVVHGITGASKTTHSVGQLINRTIASFLSGGLQLEILDLGVGVDDVTRATPGYPKHIVKPPNLREDVKRGDFMTQPGTVNLALNKTVTSSTEEPIIGELEQITDGIKKSGEFDYVELDFELQWVQIDLEKQHDIYAIVIWHFYKNPTIYRDVIVQIADNEEFTENVRTVFNNDYDESAELGKGEDTSYLAAWWGELVDTRGDDKKGVSGRYVRVHTAGGAGEEETRFVEIAVFGK